MSDELERLQHQLEQATAPECPPHARPDAETGSLREGWLALGQLLEATRPALEEPLQWRPIPRRTLRPRWALQAVAAAAALVVAATLVWSLMALGRPGGPPPRKTAAVDRKQPDAARSQPESTPDTEPLEWGDSLDEQIVLAGQEIMSAGQDWYHLDDAFGPVRDGLEQVAEDIDNSTL